MENMGTLRRTHYAREINASLIGSEVCVAGYIAKARDLGGVIFADVRDTSGIVQLAFGDGTAAETMKKAETLKAEYVVIAKGRLQKRESINKNIPTGEVEIFVDELRILSQAATPPFEVAKADKVRDELRLAYRYLDLRNERLHGIMTLRSKVAQRVRTFYDANSFVEIETPVLVKSTPEGARDYLVPSRVQPGKFYALPQSPQLYKQILMLSGFDRYFQLAKCFRDEDLRADRQPEFTQIDCEMAFAEENDIMAMHESLIAELFAEFMNTKLETPFERMPYSEAMERFGSDKPDTRFAIELCNISHLLANCGFAVFANAIAAGGSVRLINAKGMADKITRKEVDRLTETAKTYGAKGLAYLRWTNEAESSSYEKFLTEEEKQAIRTAANAKEGDVILIVADNDDTVFAALGALRLAIAKKHGLIDENKYNFLWVTDFPLFEKDEEENRLVAKHHPFTMPKEEDIPLLQTTPETCRARAYDMVVNGVELGGGSIRINDPALQAKMFEALGFTPERAEENFGFLMEAYKYGAPPHGGIAFGFDRIIQLLTGSDDIRDTIAFPKVQNAGEPMTNCPNTVDKKQLAELCIESTAQIEAE